MLGGVKYKNNNAAVFKVKYFICMKDRNILMLNGTYGRTEIKGDSGGGKR